MVGLEGRETKKEKCGGGNRSSRVCLPNFVQRAFLGGTALLPSVYKDEGLIQALGPIETYGEIHMTYIQCGWSRMSFTGI
jgi:hypothetical protein